MMSMKSVMAMIIAGGIFAASAAHADHMSVSGAGTASMPNDLHNIVIEEGVDVLQDVVIYGDGTDTVNRYLEEE